MLSTYVSYLVLHLSGWIFLVIIQNQTSSSSLVSNCLSQIEFDCKKLLGQDQLNWQQILFQRSCVSGVNFETRLQADNLYYVLTTNKTKFHASKCRFCNQVTATIMQYSKHYCSNAVTKPLRTSKQTVNSNFTTTKTISTNNNRKYEDSWQPSTYYESTKTSKFEIW
jgi:hypothetical protein